MCKHSCKLIQTNAWNTWADMKCQTPGKEEICIFKNEMKAASFLNTWVCVQSLFPVQGCPILYLLLQVTYRKPAMLENLWILYWKNIFICRQLNFGKMGQICGDWLIFFLTRYALIITWSRHTSLVMATASQSCQATLTGLRLISAGNKDYVKHPPLSSEGQTLNAV